MPEITEPGVYNLTHEEYHADPVPQGSLSQSGAKMLLPPSCPAKFKHNREHPPEPKREYDHGHAAHKLVLGKGAEIVVIDADSWRTKVAQEARKEAHTEGKIPLLTAEYERAVAMAAQIDAHPIASALFRDGEPEKSLFWRDEDIWRRALLDWLPNRREGKRLIVPDYKTTRTANPDSLQKIVWDYRYMQQADWYLDGMKALGLADDDARFVFVFQEKTEPYLVTVAEPDVVALRIGRLFNQQAIDLYRWCLNADHWPGYTGDVELITLPGWVENKYLEAAL